MGKESSYNAPNQAIGTAHMLGFIKNVGDVVAIANRILRRYFTICFYHPRRFAMRIFIAWRYRKKSVHLCRASEYGTSAGTVRDAF